MPNYHRWILAHFRPYLRGRVAEVGAGTGNITQHLTGLATDLVAVEPSASLLPSLRQRMEPHPHVKVLSSSLERWVEAEEQRFDAIVLINVLEHILDDRAALDGLRQRLVPGGHLLLFVPALELLFSRLDEKLGHYRRYHLGALRRLVEQAGLTVLDARYFDAAGVLPWYLVNTLGKKTSFDARMARVYDRVFVPVGRRLERLGRPPIGKNVVLIAQR